MGEAPNSCRCFNQWGDTWAQDVGSAVEKLGLARGVHRMGAAARNMLGVVGDEKIGLRCDEISQTVGGWA
jgi:hypothetical protein